MSAMQLVGPVRYGVYTFFLTLVALELSSVGHQGQLASRRDSVALTLIGAAAAVASGYTYDRLTRHRGQTA